MIANTTSAATSRASAPKTGILQLRERSWPRWRVLPNESRLSCGRRARQRKGLARPAELRRARQPPIPLEAGPTASSAC
jgi:hypothetical protein